MNVHLLIKPNAMKKKNRSRAQKSKSDNDVEDPEHGKRASFIDNSIKAIIESGRKKVKALLSSLFDNDWHEKYDIVTHIT